MNIENIICKASELIQQKDTVSKEEVNQDWITRFFDIAQDISDEEMQNLWVKVLSDEIDKPKSYSLRTLELIKNLSNSEGQLIERFCKQEFKRGSNILVVGNDDFFDKHDISLDDRILLEELNLVKFNLNFNLEAEERAYFSYDNKVMIITSGEKHTSFSVAQMTTVGKELYGLINKELNMQYITDVSRLIKLGGAKQIHFADEIYNPEKKEYNVTVIDEL